MILSHKVVVELFMRFLDGRHNSIKTKKLYKWVVNEFFYWLESEVKKIDLREVSKQNILNYKSFIYLIKNKKKNRYSLITQRRIMSTLTVLFRFLYRSEYILLNPLDGVDTQIVQVQSEREIIPVEEMHTFLDSISGDRIIDIQDRALFELMYGTGIRVNEVIHIDVTDLDLNDGKLLIREGKGGKDRVVPIGKSVLHCIRTYLKESRPSLLKKATTPSVSKTLFISEMGYRLNINTINRRLKRRFAITGIDRNVTPHMIRHSCATHLLDNGASLKHVKEILGHTSLQTTVLYYDKQNIMESKWHKHSNFKAFSTIYLLFTLHKKSLF